MPWTASQQHEGPTIRATATVGVAKQTLIPVHSSPNFHGEHYVEKNELGKGSFGRVALVVDRHTQQERVVKFVDTANMSKMVLDLMKKEVELLRRLDHPSIVRLYEAAEDPKHSQLILVLEYIPGGDCSDLIKDRAAPLRESLVARLIFQLFAALSYCHQRSVVHRDVKPANMMVVYPPGGGDPDCKLIDFGLAKDGVPDMMDVVGSPQYMAPQIFHIITSKSKTPYTSKADVWSAAVTAIELLCGEPPFIQPFEKTIALYKGFETVEARLNGIPGWESRSEDAKAFVRELLWSDPSLRPSAAEAMELEWLEVHKLPRQRLPKTIANSFAQYIRAPPFIRCCLLSIAARIGTPDIAVIADAFLGVDTDGDGFISTQELEEELDKDSNRTSLSWWQCGRPAAAFHAADLLLAADLDHSGGLGFTEFTAASLFSSYDTIEDIARQAFFALDDDRDGLLHVDDIRSMFRERDQDVLNTLPQDEYFGVDDWLDLVRAMEDGDDGSIDFSNTDHSEAESVSNRRILCGCGPPSKRRGRPPSVDSPEARTRQTIVCTSVTESASSSAPRMPAAATLAQLATSPLTANARHATWSPGGKVASSKVAAPLPAVSLAFMATASPSAGSFNLSSSSANALVSQSLSAPSAGSQGFKVSSSNAYAVASQALRSESSAYSPQSPSGWVPLRQSRINVPNIASIEVRSSDSQIGTPRNGSFSAVVHRPSSQPSTPRAGGASGTSCSPVFSVSNFIVGPRDGGSPCGTVKRAASQPPAFSNGWVNISNGVSSLVGKSKTQTITIGGGNMWVHSAASPAIVASSGGSSVKIRANSAEPPRGTSSIIGPPAKVVSLSASQRGITRAMTSVLSKSLDGSQRSRSLGTRRTVSFGGRESLTFDVTPSGSFTAGPQSLPAWQTSITASVSGTALSRGLTHLSSDGRAISSTSSAPGTAGMFHVLPTQTSSCCGSQVASPEAMKAAFQKASSPDAQNLMYDTENGGKRSWSYANGSVGMVLLEDRGG